eukprot:1161963-Pelagomonas_calceolata.AAC.13
MKSYRVRGKARGEGTLMIAFRQCEQESNTDLNISWCSLTRKSRANYHSWVAHLVRGCKSKHFPVGGDESGCVHPRESDSYNGS